MAALTNPEFEAFLSDGSKRIQGDIEWSDDEDRSGVKEFKAQVSSDGGSVLAVKGTYNPIVRALSFTIIHGGSGRIYALDLGKDHRNPTGELVGETHKHRWTEQYRDKQAYVPPDITASPSEVLLAWEQFCAEAKIRFDGTMSPPGAQQDHLFL